MRALCRPPGARSLSCMATAETEPASHSGKLLVRMPRSLHAELAAAADQEGVSLNAFIVGALGGAVAWRSEAPEAAAAARAGARGERRGSRARPRRAVRRPPRGRSPWRSSSTSSWSSWRRRRRSRWSSPPGRPERGGPAPVDGLVLVDKPAGKTSHDLTRRGPPRRSACAAPATPARSTRSPPACCSSSSGARGAVAALPHGAAQALRGRRAARRACRRPATRRARSRRPASRPRARSSCPPAACASARRPTAPCASRAAAPTSARARARRSRSPSARSSCTASRSSARDGDRVELLDRVLGGHVRAQPGGRARRATARSCGARAIGPFDVADADPTRVVAAGRGARVPARRARSTRTPRGAPRTARRCRRRRRTAARARCCSSTPTGPWPSPSRGTAP